MRAQGKNLSIKYFRAPPYSSNISLKRIAFNATFAIGTFGFLLKNLKRGDIVLNNSIPPETVLSASLACGLRRAQWVLDIRDIWPDALTGNGIKHWAFRAYCSAIYKLSPKNRIWKTLYVAKSFQTWMYRNNAAGRETQYLPLGYDAARWKAPPIRQDLKANRKLRIVYIGYLSMQFDLTPIIRSMQAEEALELFVIGGGSRLEYYKSISSKNVHFLGPKAPLEISETLDEVAPDIALMPLAEGAAAYMPNKLFDYIATGLPILVSGSADAAEFVHSNKIGWSVLNEENVLRAFLRKLDRSALIEAKANIAHIRPRYSMQKLYETVWGNLP